MILILTFSRQIVKRRSLDIICLLVIISLSQSLSYSVFAQTPSYSISTTESTALGFAGGSSLVGINFGDSFSAAVPISQTGNEIDRGSDIHIGTINSISSLTFTALPGTPGITAALDCNGDIYLTTGGAAVDATVFEVFVVVDDPGTTSFTSGDTHRIQFTINTLNGDQASTEPFCDPVDFIATPANPITTSFVADGFDTLDAPTRITTVKIGEFTYALVTAFNDNSIQIINMTNPLAPVAVSFVIDDVDSFDELEGANGITTITIDSSIYALVASTTDDGIQIIDITNPADPMAVFSINDGDLDGNDIAFDELAGAKNIATVKIVLPWNLMELVVSPL